MKFKIFLFSYALFFSTCIFASEDFHFITAPTCLTQKLKTPFATITTNQHISLIKIKSSGVKELIKLKTQKHITPCGGFMDVTDAWVGSKTSAPKFLNKYINHPNNINANSPYKISYEKTVNNVIQQINPQFLWSNLTTLTNFPDRSAYTDNGIKAANWLQSQITELAAAAGRVDVETFLVNGKRYKQPSLVVKLGQSTQPGIVLGAHMDTLSGLFSNRPGADDDGSGSMTLLEIARTLFNSHLEFKKPIYLIWYAAEEEGMLGSQDVVKYFQQQKIAVENVLQLDMDGFEYQNDKSIWLITDNVNNDLTNYLDLLVQNYVKKPVNRTQCGYACSDHASWSAIGVNSSMPTEGEFSHLDPHMHTADDTMAYLSLDHMADFVKLGLAFAVELAEPIT